jgi:hypothetical protein
VTSIDVAKVRGVLLADGWHEVKTGTSFEVGTYGYMKGGAPLQLYDRRGSFTFTDNHGLLTGPLTSVLAVRTSAKANEATG